MINLLASTLIVNYYISDVQSTGLKQLGKDMKKLLEPTKNPDPKDAALASSDH